MKLVSPLQICKGFTMCRGHITSFDEWSYKGGNSSKDIEFSQLFYLIEGTGTLVYGDEEVAFLDENGPKVIDAYKDDYDRVVKQLGNSYLFDFRDRYDKKYKLVAGKYGATWMAINPLPNNHFFDAELFSGIKEITGDGNNHIILCVKGEVNVISSENNKESKLVQFQYTRVLNGKKIHVVVPPGSQAIYMTRQKLINI
jgi:hypothetical protein